MLVAATRHFHDLGVMAGVQGCQPADPPSCLRMVAVSLLILRENVPEPMQLAVLGEKVLAAQSAGWEIPDAQSRSARRDDWADGGTLVLR